MSRGKVGTAGVPGEAWLTGAGSPREQLPSTPAFSIPKRRAVATKIPKQQGKWQLVCLVPPEMFGVSSSFLSFVTGASLHVTCIDTGDSHKSSISYRSNVQFLPESGVISVDIARGILEFNTHSCRDKDKNSLSFVKVKCLFGTDEHQQ